MQIVSGKCCAIQPLSRNRKAGTPPLCRNRTVSARETERQKMKKIIVAALLTTALLNAHAETTNTVNGNRIVVTATRSAAPIRSVAKNPSVITSKDIEDGRYRSVPEAL